MKQKLTLLALFIFFSCLIYGLISPATTTRSLLVQSSTQQYFPLGAMQNQIDWEHAHFTKPDKFGMNLWHLYTFSHYDAVRNQYQPQGWSLGGTERSDSLYADTSAYMGAVKIFIDIESGSTDRDSNRIKMLMQRPKIEWLCYGQRSDYQCESDQYIDDYYWFYSFDTHETGDNTPDSGKIVRVCRTMPDFPIADNPGFVVKKLRANNEQNLNWQDTLYYHGDDDQYRWYIKPRIRIDSLFAFSYPSTPVCSLKVINSDATATLKEVIIYAGNFKNPVTNSYKGQYLEEFYFPTGTNLEIQGAWGPNKYWPRGYDTTDAADVSKMDIQVYWYGNCNMWIDYVRVDNEIANDLFSTDPNNTQHTKYEQWLQWEASGTNSTAGYVPPNGFKPQYKFYIEEFEFNNIPCIAYVNKKLQQLTAPDTVDMMTCYFWKLFSMPVYKDYRSVGRWSPMRMLDADVINHTLIQPTGMRQLFTEIYPFTTTKNSPYFSKIPISLTPTIYNNSCVRAERVTPTVYDDWLQYQLDYSGFPVYDGWEDPGWFTSAIKIANQFSKISDKPFIIMPQTHSCENDGENRREPTNEEILLQTNLALSYGAKGVIYFWFGGGGDCSNYKSMNGFITLNQNDWNPLESYSGSWEPRTSNVYGQNKWDSLISVHKKIRQWAPYFLDFNSAYTNSYIYYKDNERQSFLSNSYFNYIASFKPGNPQVLCPEEIENMSDIPPEQNLIFDCQSETYVQAATFKATNSLSPYFMIVNRRCSPVITGYADGRRKIKVIFDSYHADINSSNVWDIKDLGQPGEPTVTSFYRPGSWFADLGWFEPGEGKLYKLVPAKAGGVLLADETIHSNEEITLTDTLFTNGFNLTIEEGAKLHFTDSSTIVVDGGSFTAGDLDYQGSDKITFDAAEGNHFNGLVFNNADVRIYHSEFSGLANDTTYAVYTIDCPVVDIRRSLFTAGSDNLKGAINISCLTRDDYNIYVGGNTFEAGVSNIPFVNIMAYAEVSAPAIVENNTFNSTSGASALMLSGITGGAVKSNYFYNYTLSVSALSSSIDVKENTISSSQSGSIGLEALTGTELRLNKVLGTFIGGLNTVTNTGSSSKNIFTGDSYYFLSGGENVFNVLDAQCNHLKGDFPPAAPIGVSDATVNCFKIDEVVSSPVSDVLNQGQQVSFTFEPYLTGCVPEDGGDMMVINLGDGIYDTLTIQQGAGGHPMTNDELRMTNLNNKLSNQFTFRNSQFTINAKQVYDSVCIQMRYRNYSYVKDRCMYLLNVYPDSIQSIYAVSKLYQAVSIIDTTTSGRNELKSFFESLILNHPNNTALVKRANYFVQKCKVLLKQYSSALTGFQQIINSNPYSYEALVAHWDYMAASLLMNGGAGSQREMSNVKRKTNDWLNLESDEFDESRNGVEIPISRDDEFSAFGGDPKEKSPFTKEEKKQITQTVREVQTSAREQSIIAIQVLSKQAESGNIESKKVVKVMKTLEEVVKIQRPKNVAEHIQIVKDDLKKVFGQDNKSGNGVNNNIPQTFALSQNYPNPFNPVTKINYDLPNDCKVTMVIYDILGREVIKLVNNEFKKAGRYTAIFNGSNLASGVYFYRIEADKFVQSKKMVLVK